MKKRLIALTILLCMLVSVSPTLPPEGGDSSYFSYTYQGTTYFMRYVTVTATENSVLDRMFTFAVVPDRLGILQ